MKAVLLLLVFTVGMCFGVLIEDYASSRRFYRCRYESGDIVCRPQ